MWNFPLLARANSRSEFDRERIHWWCCGFLHLYILNYFSEPQDNHNKPLYTTSLHNIFMTDIPIQVSKFTRIQSPSSINTHRQCARKYYYSYIKKLQSLPSIHLIRGKIVHSALEDFFKFDVSKLTPESFEIESKMIISNFFKTHWENNKNALSSLNLADDELKHYHDESLMMLQNFHHTFMEKLKLQSMSLAEAFKKLTPKTEKHYQSKTHGVRGFIDAIHEIENKVILMDYKTSKKDIITEDYKLQLAIYALLYQETHNILPDEVGINFLKFNEQTIKVDQELLEFAKKEVALIHEKTTSTDMKDYPKTITPLCKWHSGQCDYYNTCIKE